MKLRHETPEEYLRFCRESIQDQQRFIENLMTKREAMNLPELNEAITSQQDILYRMQDRYNQARKGIYE